MNLKKWKKLGSTIIYQTPRLIIREDRVVRPNGTRGTYMIVDNKAGVYVVAVNDKNQLYLVKQSRYPTGSITWELPGGGADPLRILASAKKELWEETGVSAKRWKKISAFESMNGWSPELTHVYVATGLTVGEKDQNNEDGILEVATVSLKTALEWVNNGKINSSQTMATLLKYQQWLATKKN